MHQEILLDTHSNRRAARLTLRTATLANASEVDLHRLAETYHVGLVVDFRMAFERQQNPDPTICGARNLHVPVLDMEDVPGFDPDKLKQIPDLATDRTEMLRMAIESGMLDASLYQRFLFSERGKAGYRRFFQGLLGLPEEQAILWHCTDGKDRMGIASMLLLTALGASRETVMEDYLLTNEFNAELIAKARGMLERMPMDDAMRRRMLFGMGCVHEEYMATTLSALDENCGSAEAYLAKELGIGKSETEALRHKFLN